MLLEVKDIHKSFVTGVRKIDVLKGISMELEKGEICVLLGPSGSGKSTLLNIIGGIDTPDKGTFFFDGDEITGYSENELSLYRRKRLAYVFQTYNLIPNLTLKENIESGAYLSENPLNIDELLNVLGLYKLEDKLPSELSGGEQQRCAIGRAVVKNPDLLLCDEPTGALDYENSKEILKLLESINKKYSTTMLIVTHNEAIQHMADQIIRLHDGHVRSAEKNTNKIAAEDITW